MGHQLSRTRILDDPVNCTSGKPSFLTLAEAEENLARARAIRADHGPRIPGRVEARIYECSTNGTVHYHLTADPRPPRPGRTRGGGKRRSRSG